MKLSTYEVANANLVIFVYRFATRDIHTEDNGEFRTFLRKNFFNKKKERYQEIENLLVVNNLPTDFSKKDNLMTVEKWIYENIEDNGMPASNNIHNKKNILEHAIQGIPEQEYLENRMANRLWFSIIFDLAVKIGEDKIREHPHLKWKMQTTAPRMLDYNNMSLYGFKNGYSKNFHYEIMHMIGNIGDRVDKEKIIPESKFILPTISGQIDGFA